MVAHITHINEVVAILSRREGTTKQRLAKACDRLWAAMEDPDEWPTDLMERVNLIVDKILESSSIGCPVRNMDEATARRVTTAIIKVAAELRSRGLVPPL